LDVFGKRSNWNIDKLRAYIATVKSRFHPSISADASILLERHYSECRGSEYIEVQVTVRLLESLIRLAQAHARLMHRNVVELDDAIAVILLMECSVASTSATSFNSLYTDPTNAIFPDDDVADTEFILEKMKVLEKYQMLDRLTDDEVKIITEQNAMAQYSNEADPNGWDDIEANQSMPYSSPPSYDHNHPSHDNNVTQDHYGRFTQQKSPSPHKRRPRNDYDDNYDNGEDHDTNDSSRTGNSNNKRRRNHSAD